MPPAVYRSLVLRRCTMVGLGKTSLYTMLPLIHRTGMREGVLPEKFRPRYESETVSIRSSTLPQAKLQYEMCRPPLDKVNLPFTNLLIKNRAGMRPARTMPTINTVQHSWNLPTWLYRSQNARSISQWHSKQLPALSVSWKRSSLRVDRF